MMKVYLQTCWNSVRIGILCMAVACLFSTSMLSGNAQEKQPHPTDRDMERITVYINGTEYVGRAVLFQDTTYVDLREFTREVYPGNAVWNYKEQTATFQGEGLVVRAGNGMTYINANERYLWCPTGVFAGSTYTYVPIRALAKAVGADIVWNAEESAVYITTGTAPILHGDKYYLKDEVYWLSRIIYAEAGIEPFIGQIAVGNVVLNRVREAYFPDTIYSVIFDRSCGVQFSPTANGMIYCVPDAEAVIAAKLCLEGYTVSDKILYFLNPALATNFWVPQNCDYVMTIAGHDFYS